MTEYGVAKVEVQPLVQDGTYIDPSTDTSPVPAEAALVAIVGTPSIGDVPTFDGTKFAPAAPGAVSSTFDPATRSDAIASALAAEATARTLAGASTLDDLQVQLTAQFYGA